MAKPIQEDDAILAEFAHLDDRELLEELKARERALSQFRRQSGRTKDVAHRRVDDMRAEARREYAKELAALRFAFAVQPDVPWAYCGKLAQLWALISDDELIGQVHATIDAPPAAGEAEPFVAGSEADYKRERARLDAGINRVHAGRELRLLVTGSETIDRKRNQLRERLGV